MRMILPLLVLLPVGTASMDRTLPKAPGADADAQVVAAEVIERTNAFRKKNGLPPLSTSTELGKAAKGFARYMAKTQTYGHEADGRTPAQRAGAAGYRYCAVRENIEYEYDSRPIESKTLGKALFIGWRESPHHRENMLAREVIEIAVAVARAPDSGAYFAVQMFGRPLSAMVKFRVQNATRSAQGYAITAPDMARSEHSIGPGVTRTHGFCEAVTVIARDKALQGASGRLLRFESPDGTVTFRDATP